MSQPQTLPFVVHDAAGRILRHGRAPADDLHLQAEPGEGVIMGHGSAALDWVNPTTGLIEQRPAVLLAPAVSLAVAAEWEIGLVPAGTQVILDGALLAETSGDALTLQFAVSASYQLDLAPPWPWRAATRPASSRWSEMVRLVIDGGAKLSALRREAIVRINARAGEVRGRYITIAPGQEMIYLGKEAEALRWLTAPSPVLADYPFITAEVGITALTPQALAELWRDMAAQWRVVGSAIEQARLGAVAAIEGGVSASAIAAAVAGWEAAAAAFEALADA